MNRSFSHNLKISILGCVFYKFEHVVKELLTKENPIIIQVQKLMNRLWTTLLPVRVQQQTPSRPNILNDAW